MSQNYIRKDCQYCGSFSPSSSTGHLHTDYSLSWRCSSASQGVSDGDGAPGWEVYLTGLHLKWGSDTIINNSKAGEKNMDTPDPKRSCPFPVVTNYSWQFVMLSRVSSPPPHYLQGQNQVRKTWDTWFQQSLPTQRARNSKRKSTPPPEVFRTSRLHHTGSPQLWVHLAANIYSALPHWFLEECWPHDILRCHDMTNK